MPSAATGTNLQEPGVEEADSVKVDGTRLVVLDAAPRPTLAVLDVAADRPRRTGHVAVGDGAR